MPSPSVPFALFAGVLVLFAILPLALQLRGRGAADSPWFWAYWFGIFALVALFLATPKFQHRQAAIEREYQGRTRAAQNLHGQEPDVELSAPGNTEITLWPLYGGLSAITIVSWLVYFASGRQSAAAPAASPPGNDRKASAA